MSHWSEISGLWDGWWSFAKIQSSDFCLVSIQCGWEAPTGEHKLEEEFFRAYGEDRGEGGSRSTLKYGSDPRDYAEGKENRS